MKITKSQLKQIIKEEISKVLNEDDGAAVPKGATVIPSSDPTGIAYFIGDDYGEIGAYELDLNILQQIAKRPDLKFKFEREDVSGHDFMDRLPEYWYDTAKSKSDEGFMVSLPDWVPEALGRPPLEDEDY